MEKEQALGLTGCVAQKNNDRKNDRYPQLNLAASTTKLPDPEIQGEAGWSMVRHGASTAPQPKRRPSAKERVEACLLPVWHMREAEGVTTAAVLTANEAKGQYADA